LLKAAVAIPLLSGAMLPRFLGTAFAASQRAALPHSRVRPGDPAWPSAKAWAKLNEDVGGQLLKLESPFAHCSAKPLSAACSEALAQLKNPYFIGDQPALTQTSGWVDAWTSRPSAYAIAARNSADVVAAVNFAREHHLRLVVKGGGHSYQGTSSAPDSLLVWTRHMNDVSLQENFVAQGCAGKHAPQPAVSVGAGAMWSDAYHAVTTVGGRYVQGGGCTTVGVAGLVQSGGFGSFSKNYGTAAAGLLEAEIVTADGKLRIANACTNPDLFWGIKGGGGGSLGVVTRLTLRTRELPETFGGVFGEIKASSDDAYRALIAKLVDFYQSVLFNAHWGEQVNFTSDSIKISMVFQGLSRDQAEAAWAPLVEWVNARKEYSFKKPLQTLSLPAGNFWDPEYFKAHAPGILVADDRPGAPAAHVVWAGDKEQVGWFIHGYKSAWMPTSLLSKGRQSQLVDALFASTRHWDVGMHFNKGLAGAAASEIEAARDTATNPEVLDAFALAIIAGSGDPAYAGLPDANPDLASARDDAKHLEQAMAELLKAAPGAGSYVSESDYFERDWQKAFWGENYPKLSAVKQKYDPDGLFFVHHGVGSEAWSEDGFTRLRG
jgi:FAD/FMN-containing dehydrogenase